MIYLLVLLALRGDYDRAIRDTTQAITLRPDFAEAYDSRGFAYNGKGNHDQAIADYNQALTLNPNLTETYYHRGDAYRAKRDQQKGITDFKRFLELSKDPSLRAKVIGYLKELDKNP